MDAVLGGVLDPDDWDNFRTQSHQMLDDMIDHLQTLRQRPVWQPAPEAIRQRFKSPLPKGETALSVLHAEFMQYILPFAVGNTHPGFMGWVHGGGTPVGMVAEMLAAGLNANLGGRNQIPLEVERQIIDWMRQLFALPEPTSGVLVAGTSSASLIALTTARNRAQEQGIPTDTLVAYASSEVHGCIARALDVIGLGRGALRKVACNGQQQIDLLSLQQQIAEDRAQGKSPWLVVGCAGTVNTGAIDDLAALSAIAQREQLWLHIDGAFGALSILAPEIAPRLRGIEMADSLAMDFHKWGQVPYDAGLVLIRDGALHQRSFAATDSYLQRETHGLAANTPWPCDYGIDLSRGFRALKVWFTLKAFGSEKLGAMISHCCQLARELEQLVSDHPQLELAAPVSLNIVCFYHTGSEIRSHTDDDPLTPEQLNALNRAIVRHIQCSGLAAPSLATVAGRSVIRAAIVNHRTRSEDIIRLIDATEAAAIAYQIPTHRSTS
ncbi:MAG: pyridoxal-dependent decarboxylase [Mariprofundales bacterium]|nr:pyridoxal-dependent decarboxylase [Mariprofundales bacterium]